MHELAICRSLVDQLEALAVRHGAARIDSARVAIGPLSGVEPSLLRRAFEVARAGTVARTARLDVETGPVRLRCTLCGAVSQASPGRLVCGCCGDWRVRVEEGQEATLKTVEFTRAASAASAAGRGERDV